jgi:hypothetical protein
MLNEKDSPVAFVMVGLGPTIHVTMRMHMRRFTRLTNAFSKKAENHAYAVALHFMYYNFCRIHMSLRTSPAMRAGVSDTLWKLWI